ncbi:MAG: hypothetical protein HYX68_28975 [Planctomycetes bacterium]|jgi:hypothetical protein|nr:hypothetical protein [Planctomycetota bacterium]
MVAWELFAELASWIVRMAWVLDRRIQERLLALMVGAFFGQGRRLAGVVQFTVGQAFQPGVSRLLSGKNA